MYDPAGSDTNREWIEIYNNNSDIDISGWKFYEDETNHGLTLKNGTWAIKNNSYAIIADNWEYFLQDYPNFNGTLFDSSFSLLNTEEFIAIKNSTTYFIDNLTYNNSLIPCNEGNSIQLINGSWYASSPTPGMENIFIFNETNETSQNITENITGKDLEITIYLDSILNIFVEYTSLFKITNLDHETGVTDHINLTVFYNISINNNLVKEDFFNITDLNSYKSANTGSIIFNETGNFTICGKIINTTETNYNKYNDIICENRFVIDTLTIPCNVSISLSTERLIYNNSEQIKFYNLLNNESFLYKIEYWIEDLFGNEAKSKYNTSNTNQKSWTPNIDESDQVFLIKNRIAELYCNDTNLEDNSAEKLIIVKGERKKESIINITEVYLGTDNKVKFGESLRIRVNIYKGDETKNQVKLWLEKNDEKISKVTSTNLYTNFINYDLTLAVQIDPNCDEQYPDSDYTLFLTAFDKNDSATIPISGVTASNCKTTTKYISGGSSEKETTKQFYEIISIPSEVILSKEFASKIRLNNEDKTDNQYSIWSYVYRGNKCYSGEREGNTQTLSIPSGSSALIELKNTALEEGDFNFKINIRKNDQKTTKDITQSINVLALEKEKNLESEESKTKEEKEETLTKTDTIKNIFLSEKEPKTIYLSSSSKARNLISFFILFLLAFLLISIIWKKTI